jgi:hypothetical protein
MAVMLCSLKYVPGYRQANRIYSIKDMMATDFGKLLYEEKEKNYGTDMVVLVKMLENGDF